MFILRMGEEPEKIWSWRAEDAPGLPEQMKGQFGSTDECKPVRGGKQILITASTGGVAMVNRESKEAVFWASVVNAHSAEVLPNDRIAVASSIGGHRLIVFDLSTPEREVLSVELPRGHGVIWDEERERLYALAHGDIRIYRLADWETDTPSLEMELLFELPEVGGHDLQLLPGTSSLMLSTRYHCWLYDRDARALSPHPDLADLAGVKCICVNPRTGQLVYQQKEPDHWWSERFQFLRPQNEYHVPGEHFYKARWNASSD